MNGDSIEQIKRCLSCKKEQCTNCAQYSVEPAYNTPGKAVVGRGKGEELRFKSTAAAARAVGVSPQAIQQAIRRGSRSGGYFWTFDKGDKT